MGRNRRAPIGKKINPTLFVFCEGQTEESYVNLLKTEYRLPSIHIHPKIRGNNITSKYILNYKKDKPTHEKDLNFLFYDLDAPAMLQRLNQINNCILLVSNPCVELWFLLHYKNQTADSSSTHCYREMKNRNNSYRKGVIDNKLRDKLISRKDEAVKRAKRLKEYVNPSTTVYKLVEELKKLKNGVL